VFGRLIQKELLHHLLDFRFVAVFALCALLSVLSVYVGGRNYTRQLQEYAATAENHRKSLQVYIDKGNLNWLRGNSYRWNRRPEVLSPVVYGLSGVLGQEVLIHYWYLPRFEASLFEGDAVYALFGVLDLAFIVKVVLSLTVLLFTYDAICGEKEGGTLRLYASFPVARSTLAASKLIGSTVAVLVSFAFAFLLAAAVLSLLPAIHMQGEDWLRMVALVVLFALYLTVFAAFGLWVSALTHRRMTAFLGLLGLWTTWLFVIPDMAVRIAENLTPVESSVDLQKRADVLLWEIEAKRGVEVNAYWKRNNAGSWEARNALPEAQRLAMQEEVRKIESKWDSEYYSRLRQMQEDYRNRMRRQQRTAMALSVASPLGAITFASMDLARTGFVQQERVEDALNQHLIYLAGFIRERAARFGYINAGADLSGFTPFDYRDRETSGECLSRNLIPILNLALLAVLGFAGAYVFILRYDVR
jgi:ABC-type transport system involved in multi-copper enzyme maturation permease subunit